MTEPLAAFLRAYDEWEDSSELCAGPLFDRMIEARQAMRTWTTFCSVHQAQPGRRMRGSLGFESTQVFMVDRAELRGRVMSIIFEDGSVISVGMAKKLLWEIEI